jgi:hypothetical protein
MCKPAVTSAVSSAARIAAAMRRVSAGRKHAVRILVPEIPRPERVVAGKRGCDFKGQQSLCVRDDRIGIPVAEPGFDHRPTRDDSEANVAVRAAERPRRDPVHPAHVAREQRRNERKPELAGKIGHGDELLDHRPVDLIRGRLEVLPGQKDANGVEPAVGDPREVGCDLCAIELRPPAHRRARGPVVHADAKPFRCQFRIRR